MNLDKIKLNGISDNTVEEMRKKLTLKKDFISQKGWEAIDGIIRMLPRFKDSPNLRELNLKWGKIQGYVNNKCINSVESSIIINTIAYPIFLELKDGLAPTDSNEQQQQDAAKPVDGYQEHINAIWAAKGKTQQANARANAIQYLEDNGKFLRAADKEELLEAIKEASYCVSNGITKDKYSDSERASSE